jgi:glyoxylase-like metal-dependent hydrolase (beta-lactamase superfamily II)
MTAKQIVEGVYVIPLGIVNAFLIDADGLTLIDTGIPGSAGKILAAVEELGRRPDEIHQVLITHLHRDHTGSLAAIKRATGAPVYMHAVDAALIRQGIAGRPTHQAPGLFAAVLTRVVGPRGETPRMEMIAVEHEVQDNEVLPAAGGVRALHTPGHTAGHLMYLWPQRGGVLFVGEALTNVFGLDQPPIYEDLATAQTSLKKIAGLDYDTICFSHGTAIVGNAAQRVRQKIITLAG